VLAFPSIVMVTPAANSWMATTFICQSGGKTDSIMGLYLQPNNCQLSFPPVFLPLFTENDVVGERSGERF
jgi:hypothetical protein